MCSPRNIGQKKTSQKLAFPPVSINSVKINITFVDNVRILYYIVSNKTNNNLVLQVEI